MSSLGLYMFMFLYSVTAVIMASVELWFIQYFLPKRLTELYEFEKTIGPNKKV
jgi:hypothetical protein